MSKKQISLIALLILSLMANGMLLMRSPSSVTTPEPPSEKTTPASLPQFIPTQLDQKSLTHLNAAGLTDSELRNIRVALINREFDHVRDDLRRIDNSSLTDEEIHTLGLVRLEKIREAEQHRREELENLVGKPWAQIDLDYNWSKMWLFMTFSAIDAGMKGSTIAEFNSLIVEGAREISFDESAQIEIIARQEGQMRELVGEEMFLEFFKPYVMMLKEDVWNMEKHFGRKLSEEEYETIATLLLPAHPLGEIIGNPTLGTRSFPDSILPELRQLVGDESFSNLLKFQSADDPDLDWDTAQHLRLYEFEKHFKTDAAAGNPQASLSSILDEEQVSAYLGSARGSWLLVETEIPQR